MKPEIYLPSLPDFIVSGKDFDSFDVNVSFDLVFGRIELNVYMNAECVFTKRDYGVDSDPQNNVERNCFYYKVDYKTTAVYVDGGDVESVGLIDGQKLKLNEKQANDLNEILESMMEWC